MGITTSNKELSTTGIECGGSFDITLSLAAEPDILTNPTDIVLILDRSQSMAGSPLANLKSGAKKFIEIIDEATDSDKDGEIGNGSRIGIVSFSDTATQDTALITSVDLLNTAVNALTADGRTNHADAFEKALDLFDPASTNAKIMVMFTDGVTTAGGNPALVAASAKAQGVTIYVIGLSGNGGIDEDAINEWASDPDSSYVAITPDDEELEDLFENLARNITNPGATDIVLTDTVSSCFRITSLTTPTKGTASLIGSNTLRWSIDELGVTQSEGAVLRFTVEHIGPCSGTVEVNESIDYDDAEGNAVNFPSPEIIVDCGSEICVDGCPEVAELTVGGCGDFIEFDGGELEMSSLGRILQLSVTLKNVCPNKRVALAVIIAEVGCDGTEYSRGLKTMSIPAHTGDGCRDVTVRCIRFVLPEELSCNASGMCNTRCLRARFIANYIDSDFACGDIL